MLAFQNLRISFFPQGWNLSWEFLTAFQNNVFCRSNAFWSFTILEFHFSRGAQIYRGSFDGVWKQCILSIATLSGLSKCKHFIFPQGRNLSLLRLITLSQIKARPMSVAWAARHLSTEVYYAKDRLLQKCAASVRTHCTCEKIAELTLEYNRICSRKCFRCWV